jgi:hypothetical protein
VVHAIGGGPAPAPAPAVTVPIPIAARFRRRGTDRVTSTSGSAWQTLSS